jgi:hypothetical protein
MIRRILLAGLVLVLTTAAAVWVAHIRIATPVLPPIAADDVARTSKPYVTSDATTEASRAEAVPLGLHDVFEEHVGWTGTVLVVDPRTKMVSTAIHGSRDIGEYRRAIDAHLDKVP